MTQRASGWYDDPQDETQLRYFDGILWSDRTMPKLRPDLEHVGEARPASEQPRHEEPHRRDGEPRTYPAHWGPEEPTHPHPHFPSPPAAGASHGSQRSASRVGAPAGLGQRFVAYIIDNIVLGLVVAVGVSIFAPDVVSQMQDWIHDVMDTARSGSAATPDMPSSLQTALTVITVASAVTGTLYDALMTAFARGRTLGRMAMGIAVVPAESHPGETATAKVSLGKALLRAAVKWLPGVIGTVGELVRIVLFFSALGNKRRAGLHDRAAGTLVRRRR